MARGEEISFRLMKVDDLEQLMEVEHASFTTPWTKEAFFHELVHNDFAYYVVAVKDERIVGYCGVWIIMDEAHITNVAVHPKVRGRRIGEMLMRQVISLSMAYGATRMTLEVRVSNQVAQGLYKKLGFKETGIRKGYYTDNHEDALIMWVDLDESKGIEAFSENFRN